MLIWDQCIISLRRDWKILEFNFNSPSSTFFVHAQLETTTEFTHSRNEISPPILHLE